MRFARLNEVLEDEGFDLTRVCVVIKRVGMYYRYLGAPLA